MLTPAWSDTSVVGSNLSKMSACELTIFRNSGQFGKSICVI